MVRTLEEVKRRFARNEDTCRRVIDILALMSNKTRFRILCVLAEGDFCVTEIADAIEIGKLSNVSHQLKILTLAGVLEKSRDKQNIVYHLRDRRVADLIEILEEQFA